MHMAVSEMDLRVQFTAPQTYMYFREVLRIFYEVEKKIHTKRNKWVQYSPNQIVTFEIARNMLKYNWKLNEHLPKCEV